MSTDNCTVKASVEDEHELDELDMGDDLEPIFTSDRQTTICEFKRP